MQSIKVLKRNGNNMYHLLKHLINMHVPQIVYSYGSYHFTNHSKTQWFVYVPLDSTLNKTGNVRIT